MRTLFLTIGAPASGKTAWIAENGLQDFTIDSDNIRQLVGNRVAYLVNDELRYDYDYENDRKVWQLIYDLGEARMARGETTFISATHLFKGAFSTWRKIAAKYRYKIIAIDFMKELSALTDAEIVQLLADRDQKYRQGKILKRDVFEKYVRRYRDFIRNGHDFDLVSPDEAKAMLFANPVKADFNHFNKITIIGDIHGDYSNLSKVFEAHQKGDAYVFVGDYLDRGTKNAETLQFLMNLRGKNIFFLRGNHERHLENYAHDREIFSHQFRDFTQPELEAAGIEKSEIRKFIKQFKDELYFEFRGKSYFVSHAGLDKVQFEAFFTDQTSILLTNERVFLDGISELHNSPYDVDIDREKTLTAGVYNVHGYRNNFHNDWSLTEEGEFRTLTLTDDGQMIFRKEKSIDKASFVQLIKQDKDVATIAAVEDGEDTIFAHNFKREVFEDRSGKRCTPKTMSARGLFTRGDEIVGRGFPKFFNVNKNPEATLESLQFPVEIYEKYNGFLAITFWDTKKQELRIFNKSGREISWGTLAIATKIISEQFGEKLTTYLSAHPENSVLFEVMAPGLGDSHIIVYDHDFAVPIAVLNNQTAKFDADGEQIFGIQPMAVAENREQLDEIIAREMQDLDEGIVLRGRNKQLKLKTPFYLKAKELRTALQSRNKKNFYYGAQDWTARAKREREQFSAELALRYAKEDEQK